MNIVNCLDRHMGGGGPDDNAAQAGHLVPEIVGQAISSKWSKGSSGPAGDEHHNLIPVAHTLRSEGADASEDGTGRGTPRVPISFNWQSGGSADFISPRETHTDALSCHQTPAVAYQCHGSNVGEMGTLRSGNGHVSGGVPFISESSYTHQSRQDSINSINGPADALCPSRTRISQGYHVGPMAVRRLTPRECERLQGFPDDWTRFAADGKEISDSARYRMLGNAVCVNVAEWIGKRLMSVGR